MNSLLVQTFDLHICSVHCMIRYDVILIHLYKLCLQKLILHKTIGVIFKLIGHYDLGKRFNFFMASLGFEPLSRSLNLVLLYLFVFDHKTFLSFL